MHTEAACHRRRRVVALVWTLATFACAALLGQTTLPVIGQAFGSVSADELGGQLFGLDSGFVTVGGDDVYWLHWNGAGWVLDLVVGASEPRVAGAGELIAVWDGDLLRAYEVQNGSVVAAGTGSLAALPDADRRLIATDGTRIVVVVATDVSTYEGHVFVRSGASWTIQTALGTDIDGKVSYARALEIEGGRVFVGTGSELFWYVVPGTVAPAPPQLLEAPFFSSGFGTAISADGSRLAVGAPLTPFGFLNPIGGAGSVYLYQFDPGSNGWTLDASVSSPAPASGARFGSGVLLAGTVLAVGEPFTSGGSDPGNAFVFRQDSPWQHLFSLQQSVTHNGQLFGTAVAGSDFVAVGAPATDALLQFDNGGVFVFDGLPIFTDGFESGDVSHWSSSVP